MANWNRWVMAGVVVLRGGVTLAAAPLAAGPGQIIEAPNGRGSMEQLTVEPGLAAALATVPLDGSVAIESWPVAPGIRQDVVVTRHQIYADDARIVAIDGGREVEVPRSTLVFLWGHATDDESVSVLVSVDPEAGSISGSSSSAHGVYDLHAPRGGEAVHILAPEGALEGGSGFSCDVDALPPVRRDRGTSRTPGASKALTSLNTAVLAFDTDNELLNLKFADNTTTAANYVAGVVAQLNVIYERDLFVRFLQGYTILRVSTTPDPYLATGTSSEKLVEFRTYWNSNYASVQRAAVAMLSGKSASASSANGIGYVGVLCREDAAFTFNQVFRNGTAATANDGRLIGHEIGHNLGAGHTHNADTNPAMAGTQPIDFCVADPAWNPPQGVSCPALFDITTASGAVVTGVRGTLMSYCNMLTGCTHMGVFHPLSISLSITPYLDASGQCLVPVPSSPAPVVASISPANGPVTGGTAVTIDGSNFRSPATVTFVDKGGAKPATSVSVVSGTRITAIAPAHSQGAKSVLVQNPDAASGTLPDAFTYLGAVGRFFSLPPCRLIDTRRVTGALGGPALTPSGLRSFNLAGTCGVPPSAQALSVNVTVTGATAPGYLTIYPAYTAAPLASNVNFSAGETQGNNAVLAVSTAGNATIAVQNGSANEVHFILDVNGYFQ